MESGSRSPMHALTPERPTSPGGAVRIRDQEQETKTIENLSKRLAENLLTKESPTTESSVKYVSLNEQIQKQQEQRQKAMLAEQSSELPDVHRAACYNQLVESTSMNLLDESNVMDTSVMTMAKPGATELPRTQTMWQNQNGITVSHANDSNHEQADELDILTALSGEPTPNSLPNVTDGLSDGEVSSDSSDEEDIPPTELTSARLNRMHSRPDDPFFANHDTIMKTKSAEEISAMQAAIKDITSLRSAPKAEPDTEDRPEAPIWEIRESYAETLRRQEEKRRQRMEMERRYEQEYRDQQLEEIYKLEQENNKVLPIQDLDLDKEEVLNTDYSSEEEMHEHEGEPSKPWGWGGNKKYMRLNTDEQSCGRVADLGHSAVMSSHTTQISNAGRIADYHTVTSPGPSRRKNKTPAKRLSSGSVNSVSSSSHSSSLAATARHKNGTRDSISSSSSTSSWDSVDANADQITLTKKPQAQGTEYDTDEETDKLLHKPYEGEARVDLPADNRELAEQAMKNKAKEVTVYDPDEPTVLIEGILFRAAYLGSTQLMSEAQPSKAMRMMQAQEAVGRIKMADGESQPSTDVDLFVSTEKVMVLNTDLKEIMMDHSLRSISYIADINDILVLMAKRSVVGEASNKQQKLICHIFESDEASLIAKSIGQAFQVAYMEFLKANGIDEPNILKDAHYEDILEQQEIMNDELETFTRHDMQKDVIVPKSKGEALGVVIVESGWGSVLPTVVLANMSPIGAAARCGQLNIGDQIMSVNGISLVGLPLSTCQEHIKAVKNLTAVRLCVVSRSPVVEVIIKRPERKYQLGFSVQNGVICSLLRGGIAERGGIRVGHRIIEINGTSVVAVSHDKIVHMLSTSVGEIHMKTMPMAVFRLLTGQEIPQYI